MHICDTCNMTPVSATARSLGCTCPVLDNGHGHGCRRGSREWTISDDCPVHTGVNPNWTYPTPDQRAAP